MFWWRSEDNRRMRDVFPWWGREAAKRGNSWSETKALQRPYVSILHWLTSSSLPLALGESFIWIRWSIRPETQDEAGATFTWASHTHTQTRSNTCIWTPFICFMCPLKIAIFKSYSISWHSADSLQDEDEQNTDSEEMSFMLHWQHFQVMQVHNRKPRKQFTTRVTAMLLNLYCSQGRQSHYLIISRVCLIEILFLQY